MIAPEFVALDKFDAKEVKLSDSQKQNLDANNQNFDEIASLTQKFNTLNQDEQSRLLEKALPGFSDMQGKLQNQFNSDITDPFNMSKDMQDFLASKGAEMGISTGIGGSDASKMSLIKQFGERGFDMANQRIQRAQGLFSQLVQTAPTVSPVSPFAFATTTEQMQNQRQNYENQRLAADIQFKTLDQATRQADKNAQAAVANQNALAKSKEKGGFMDAITGAIGGAASGFMAGGPWGAVAGGVLGGVSGGIGLGDSSGQLGGLGGGLYKEMFDNKAVTTNATPSSIAKPTPSSSSYYDSMTKYRPIWG